MTQSPTPMRSYSPMRGPSWLPPPQPVEVGFYYYSPISIIMYKAALGHCKMHIHAQSHMKLPGTVSGCFLSRWLRLIANGFYLLTLIMYAYIPMLILYTTITRGQ